MLAGNADQQNTDVIELNDECYNLLITNMPGRTFNIEMEEREVNKETLLDTTQPKRKSHAPAHYTPYRDYEIELMEYVKFSLELFFMSSFLWNVISLKRKIKNRDASPILSA